MLNHCLCANLADVIYGAFLVPILHVSKIFFNYGLKNASLS